MSKRTRQFFDGLKTAKEVALDCAPGLRSLLPEMKAELGRLGTQGAMELASALFNGSAFVPYGPGQYTPSVEPSAGVHGVTKPRDHEQERGGIEM